MDRGHGEDGDPARERPGSADRAFDRAAGQGPDEPGRKEDTEQVVREATAGTVEESGRDCRAGREAREADARRLADPGAVPSHRHGEEHRKEEQAPAEYNAARNLGTPPRGPRLGEIPRL